MATPSAIIWSNNQLQLLDQRILPARCEYLHYDDPFAVAEAIRNMVVRGAPAIGITAAYGMVLAAQQLASQPASVAAWCAALSAAREAIANSRPTAVNLFWALNRCDQVIEEQGNGGQVLAALRELAIQIHAEDVTINQRIGDFGASLIPHNSIVYTHCNAGALATGGYGTALGVIRSAHRDGKIKGVFAGETRPWLQGARLTSWELMQDDIPVTLAIEGAAAHLIREHKPSWIIVGADRVAANGDAANKIGTYNLAIIAKYHGTKVMVAAPTSTFDAHIDGPQIPIEQRPGNEISHSFGHQVAPTNIATSNPAFDVTPAQLIDAIVTEHGIIHQPNRERVLAHLAQNK
ncbi:Methylthioribose-1-phosphate isomerase [Zhongshania aliphaticivorans]|uniref:Methylthioribose-1-phosphate isomerase n=1 Tax=Zhongshania aliphaticivorans TaxID=1470434 RepID=A0A5S9P5V7_9GAMM|nr:S-methyl-5-thioribose-1-phosphate isomerase [Zhongshania aliphaticivorans]CAA0091391.1 Methylthioribose-1-phosphate isomerase [Zhongshania aliphaticivorans]CAA0098778.1 Methylthioribose-1-phosphate isomerase [Zhongshania aliphaticivorans]